ncbi:MAG: phosphoadenylyl-sulfate reductase [Bryobacteraceae bacterium]
MAATLQSNKLPPFPDLESLPATRLLEWAISTHGQRFGILTSFQLEGMVLVDMAWRINAAVRVVTLDTGRLPEETLAMIDTVRERYSIAVEVAYPDANEAASMVTLHGANLFYRDSSLRKLCCHVRKTRPLERKLAEFDCYATGLRREHSEERAETARVDRAGRLVKLSPLAEWSDAEVEEYASRNKVLRHPLYQRGYTSIGCAPCTRPVEPGEASRAGRWWWEDDASKECGIHVTPTGQMRRSLDVLMEQILESSSA